MNDVQSTSLNRSWLVKMTIFTVVLIGFGLWSLYDATILLPNQGVEDAKYKLYQYLDESQKAGRLLTATSVADPAAEHAALSAREQRTPAENAKLWWLTALSRVGRLDAGHTKIEDPMAAWGELDAYFKTHQPPAELAGYGIPLQWAFVAVGFGGGLLILFNIARSAAKRYTWEESTQTLTLPGGKQVTPALLADVDKRRWHKFFCSLVLTDGAPPVPLDVLKYNKLEGWVLAMEHTRFPERAVEAPAAPEAESPVVEAPPQD